MTDKFKEVIEKIEIFMEGRYVALDNIKFNGDIYLFGIWSGCSTKEILSYLWQDKFNMAYGFDSFTGLPKETEGMERYFNFKEGAYSSKKLFNEDDISKIIKYIYSYADSSKLKLIPGYFSDSLTKELIKIEGMKPASYIDIDIDLHSSTKQVLTWMLDNKLIVPGTVIYFDDWGSTQEYKGGESLAWKEAVEKYGIKYNQIYHNELGESVLKAFTVEEICGNG